MGIPIRILIVEEFETDTSKMLDEITSGGYSPIHHRVSTPAEMITALSENGWDIVILDIDMHQFVDQPALTILRDRNYNIPCIIVSGSQQSSRTEGPANRGTFFLLAYSKGQQKERPSVGLEICYNIAEKHGTAIEVETSSKGTTFSIGF